MGVRHDLLTICKRQDALLKDFLSVTITTSELILFTKLRADIFRYLAEHGPTQDDRSEYRHRAKQEYARAVAYCQKERERLEETE